MELICYWLEFVTGDWVGEGSQALKTPIGKIETEYVRINLDWRVTVVLISVVTSSYPMAGRLTIGIHSVADSTDYCLGAATISWTGENGGFMGAVKQEND